MPIFNDLIKSIKEYSPAIAKQWWGYLTILLTIASLIAGLIGIISWAKDAKPPIPIWTIVLIAFGIVGFIAANFLAFHRLRKQRDEVIKHESETTSGKKMADIVISDLHSYEISIGDRKFSLSYLLCDLKRKFTLKACIGDIMTELTVLVPSANSEDLSNAAKSILEHLSLKQITQIQIRELNPRGSYDADYYVLTDYGKKVVQNLPQLIVEGDPVFRWYGDRLGRSWRLPIKNISSNEVEDCRGQLILITGANPTYDKGLDAWPVHEYLNWSVDTDSVAIAPGATMELEMANCEGYGSPVNIAYAKGAIFRKQHAIKSFNSAIIFVYSIAAKGSPPIYVVCLFHPSRVEKDNLELVKLTTEKPVITSYQKLDSLNQDF